MALAAALNLTLPLSKRGILGYTKLVTKVYKLCQEQWLGEKYLLSVQLSEHTEC
jgi:hypothetical protein